VQDWNHKGIVIIDEAAPSNRTKFDLDFSKIHEIIRPADVRESDRIRARLRKRGPETSDYCDLRVWKMSPLGVELVQPESESLFRKGESIDLEITLSGQRMYFEGLVVDLIQENEYIKLIGIRLSKRVERSDTDDRRKTPRWLCSDDYFPTCVGPSPGKINDYMLFQVRDVSLNGMQLLCSLRNKFLIPDMTLRLTVNFPTIGDFVAVVRIVRVGFATDTGKDRLSVGVQFLEITDYMRRTMGQYLVQFSNVESLEELRSFGYRPNSITRAVDFYYLKTEEDYREVLALRRIAHESDSNLRTSALTDEDMGDINDAEARILVGKYNGKIIATARIRFNTLDDPLEHEQFVTWPDQLPRRDQILEVSRVCNHPDFRRADLLAGLFQFACATCIQHERPWVLIGSWTNMVSFYEKLGFRKTGLHHSEELWRTEQHLMISNANDTMLGRGVNPIYWNLIWRMVSDHTIENGIIKPHGLDRVRLFIYKVVGPFAQLLFRLRRSPRRSRG
jgi:predicted GNAT family N-acyltransferase